MFYFLMACQSNVGEDQNSGTNLSHFKMMLTDSLTEVCSMSERELWPSLFIYFDPDCDHCKHTIEALLKQKERFREVNIYLLGLSSYQKLKAFEKHYDLKLYKNIVVAKDTRLSYIYKYQGNGVPLIAVYNVNRQMAALFRDSVGIETIAKSLKL